MGGFDRKIALKPYLETITNFKNWLRKTRSKQG